MHAPLLALLLLFSAPLAIAEYDNDDYFGVERSPKRGWGDFGRSNDKPKSKPSVRKHPWWVSVLLWPPNRVADLLDIFRVDGGLGVSFGAVARISQSAQVGYRRMEPASVRIGLLGRRAPVMVETADEWGVSPQYFKSSDREVCPSEIGLGADLLLGGYGGICIEEILDFGAGIFFMDPQTDDFR